MNFKIYLSNIRHLLIITALSLFIWTCNSRTTGPDIATNPPVVDPVGSNTTFDMAFWNIEWFPKNGAVTINKVKDIIRAIDVDMIGVEEIANVNAFNTLLDSLPGWKGVLSNDQYSDGSYQKTGIVYNAQLISLSNVHNIFNGDHYAFPRPPLQAYAEVKDKDGVKYNFTIIVVHLKAFGDSNSQARRKDACDKLQSYIASEINAGTDPDFIVLGDWNDDVDDPPADNVFEAFLNRGSEYVFLTAGLQEASYIGGSTGNIIDNIMLTKDSMTEYGNGSTHVLYIDNDISGYRDNVSDHRPVITHFKGFSINPVE